MTWPSALDRKLFRDLWHLRGQALAVGIIVACGVAILLMALSALQSLQTSREAYYEQFRFADVFATATRAPERLAADIRNIPGVHQVETRITAIVTLDLPALGEPANGQLVSVPDAQGPVLNGVFLHAGTWPDLTRPDEVIVSKAFADANTLGLGDSVRAILKGRARDLAIVGIGDSPEFIYSLGPATLLPDDARFGVFWMRRRALEAAFDLDGAFNSVSLTLVSEASAETVIDRLDELLAPFAGIGAFAREDQISHAFIESEMQQLVSMSRVIPPVFLIVSTVLIHAILSRLVATERQQVGLLKAFGFSSREIGWHYVKFAIILSAAGVLAGFALGAGLARLLTHLYSDTFRFPQILFSVSPIGFLVSAIAALSAAIVGALGAASRAGGLAPAEAMQPAPPTLYRRGLLESAGLDRRLDGLSRMILRHLTRWPGRALATAFGIAASMSLLVGTLFAFDSIDSLLETRFFRTDAYDAVINFTEPVNAASAIDLSRLPGVILIDLNRTVSARLRHGQHHERAVLTGLEPGGRQKQMVGLSGDRASVPETGLALSTQMARLLGAEPGDMITVEVLEGRRPVTQLQVTALVADDIGAPSYIAMGELNRLMGEGAVASGAFLSIDPDARTDFTRAILARPVIAAVSLQDAAINAFDETLKETIFIMMSIYALIGGSIAAGVVYNAARISLTERGRELASLRVLGFTESEVTYILLGELALLVVAAIPVGALLGKGFAALIVAGMSTDLYRVPFVLEPSTYGLAGLVVMVASILSAVLVAWRIRALDLISVLKTRE